MKKRNHSRERISAKSKKFDHDTFCIQSKISEGKDKWQSKSFRKKPKYQTKCISQYYQSQQQWRKGKQRRSYSPVGRVDKYQFQPIFDNPKGTHKMNSDAHKLTSGMIKSIESLREINRVLEEQNENLKEQNNFLIKKIQKMRVEHHQEKGSLQDIIQQLYFENSEYKLRIKQQQIKLIKNVPDNSLSTISNEIVEEVESLDVLQKKFERVLQEYQKTKNIQLKKVCIQIAKKIKKAKPKLVEAHRFSKPQPKINHRRNQTTPFVTKGKTKKFYDE